jgi:putative ABC transport system ATP-binding protein
MIRIQHLNKSYTQGESQSTILKDINLTIAKGETIILKGVSGSGKTTLLSLIAGLERPTSGSLLIDQEPIHKLPDLFASKLRADKIGMIFQHFNLMEHLSVAENVMIPLIPRRWHLKKINQQVTQALQKANISHKANTLASRLSGGEKQRTAIARALVSAPEIILCDEPTANLDKENSLRLIAMLKTLHQEGKTIVIATHDPLFEQLSFPHRIIPIENGEIVDV